MKLRKLLLLLLILVSTAYSHAQKESLEDVLRRLDELVERREEIRQQSGKDAIERKFSLEHTPEITEYDVAHNMMGYYSDKYNDSAYYYARRMVETAGDDSIKLQLGKINEAIYTIVKGEYLWAESILVSLGRRIDPSNALRYYHAWDMLRTWQNESLSPNNEIKNSAYWSYADSMYKHRSGIDLSMASAQRILYTNPRAALDTIMNVVAQYGGELGMRFLGKRLGVAYEQLGMRDSAKYYYALSAIEDMKLGVVEHTSPHLLSLLLLKDGDRERAYRYTRVSMEDALTCGAKLRLEQVARSMPEVLDAYEQEVQTRNTRINLTMSFLVGLLVMLLVIMFLGFRMYRRLSEARKKENHLIHALTQKEQELNQALQKQTALVEEISNSSKMKDLLVGQYMRQCVNSLQQMEQYRSSLQKVAMQGSMDKLITAIKKKDFIDKQLETFYQDFDETFLQIFPNFVEQFNSLLQEDARITVPEGKLLTIDLRIHALIRLGITESEDIASFLHYSTQTIYNYRSRIRNNAICSRDEFDDMVRKL